MKRIMSITVLAAAVCVLAAGCGDGEECDCCDTTFDCKPGLSCVDLKGGSGKVCGEVGINWCHEDCD